MKNKRKRLLASLLALCMTVGLMPAQAVEADSPVESAPSDVAQIETEEAAPAEEEHILEEVIEMPEVAALAAYATSGTCGAAGNEANVTWNIDTGTNTLTISGTGAMMDYPSNAPWYDWMYNKSYKGSQYQCSVVIGEGITEIYDLRCIRISSLSLPSTLKKIGVSCFSPQDVVSGYFDTADGRKYIQNRYPLELELPASLEYVAVRAFGAFKNLTKLTIHCPDTAFHDNNDGYGAATFCDNYYLTEVVLPEGWKTIPTWMFAGDSRLTTINIPSTVTSIGNRAFEKCGQLTSVTLPEGLTEIGVAAFQKCWALNIDRFPDTLKTIGSGAFNSCNALTNFNWPAAMLDGGSIGESAFEGCTKLTTADGHLTIPDTVTIGDTAFQRCDSFTSVTLPSTTDNIGKEILNNCSGFTSITIPEGWAKVPTGTFKYCDKLETINFPSTPLEIGQEAFSGIGVTELTLPSNITTLYREAFSFCKNLKTLTIENPNLLPDPITNINETFSYCEALEEVHLPEGFKSIWQGMFKSCQKLQRIVLPDSITEIGDDAFTSCKSLVEITLPDNLTKIGTDSFMACLSLTEITIPAGVTKLRYREFENCSGLTSVTLPDTMTYIGYESFTGCEALDSIVIPASVTKISNNAFYSKHSTTGLTQVRFLGNAPTIHCEGFSTSDPAFPDTATLYYIAGKSGWTTPEWNGYRAYPILGNAEFHDSEGDYYAPIDLYHFSFQTADGVLDGVTVSYQGASLTCEAGQNEIAAGMSPVAGEFITFTRDGYHDVKLPTEVLHSFNTVQFTPISETTPFIQSVYARHDNAGGYSNLVFDTFSFKGGSTTETTQFYLDINWNGQNPGRIFISPTLLPQDGWELEGGFYDKGYLSVNMHTGDDLYLLIVADVGVHQAVKLNTIITPTEVDQDIYIGDDNNDNLAPADTGSTDISGFLSKFDFSFKFFDALKMKVEVQRDGTVKALLGVETKENLDPEEFNTIYGTIKDGLAYNSADLNDIGQARETLQSLLSNRGKGVSMGRCALVTEGEFSTFGYAEGKVVLHGENGKPKILFHEGVVGVIIGGKVEQVFQLYLNGVPVYFSGGLENKATFTVPLVSNLDEDPGLIPGNPPTKLENDFEMKLAAGLGWDSILSAGIYGKGNLILTGYIPFKFAESSLKANSAFGLEVEVFSIFETDVELFKSKDYYLWGEANASSYVLRRMSQMNWQSTSRDYLYAMPDAAQYYAVDETNTDLTQSLIKEGIYPSADVQFLNTSNNYQYAVWTDDAGETARPEANNRTMLYYTYRYRYSSGSWCDWKKVSPLVSDDGTADFNPVLKEVDGTVYVLWQNASRPLTAQDDVNSLPGLLDISCAYFWNNVSSFHLLGTVGTEYYDTVADITVVDDTPYVVWASNSTNSAFEGTGTYTIHRQAVSDDSVAEPLVTGLNQVDALTADGGKIWYSTDTDAASTALADYAVFCWDGETITQVSGQGATKPTLVNGALTWYENGSIRVGEELIPLVADTDRYQYVVSPTGMEAVVYTVDSDIRQTTLCASFNDGTGWGDPITLSGITGNVNSFEAVFDGNGALTVLACERGLDPDAPNYLSGTANLNLYTVTPYADLAITNTTYLGQSLVKGGTLDLVVDVVNNGMSAASIINISAFNGSDALSGAAYESSLPSGHSGQFYVSVPLDDPASLTDLKVEVTASGYTDSTPDDNTAGVTLRLSDVSVEGSQVSGSGADTIARTMVVNRGQTDLTDVTVNLYAEDGVTVLATQTIASLSCGKGEVISFPVTPSEDAQLLTIQASAAGLDVVDENLVANNKVTVRIDGTKKADIPVSVISSAVKNDDGTISVAAYSSVSDSGACRIYIAGYDSNGRMVDMTVSDSAFLGGMLSGNGIVKVKVFGLDDDLKPVTDVFEYDVT